MCSLFVVLVPGDHFAWSACGCSTVAGSAVNHTLPHDNRLLLIGRTEDAHSVQTSRTAVYGISCGHHRLFTKLYLLLQKKSVSFSSLGTFYPLDPVDRSAIPSAGLLSLNAPWQADIRNLKLIRNQPASSFCSVTAFSISVFQLNVLFENTSRGFVFSSSQCELPKWKELQYVNWLRINIAQQPKLRL